MKKTNLSLIFIVFLNLMLSAQNTNISEAFKISFETSESLEKYETESLLVLGYENNNYAVDIAVFPIDYSPQIYSDLKFGARKVAELMQFEDIKDGGTIPNIESAYYVITEEIYSDDQIPVFVLIILNEKFQTAFEVTVYCYNFNTDEGEKIVNSFKILD